MPGRPQPRHIEYRRVVVKVGTNVLTAGTSELNTAAMASLVEQIAAMRERGIEVLLVTSGAIAAGRHRVQASARVGALHPRDVQGRQVLAAVGQGRLMSLWDELFEQHDVVIAQALLTAMDLADRLSYLNARNTLTRLVELGVVPVINENDVVSVEEIDSRHIGDNDQLSAQVANLVDADLLLILTDIAGLYTADPARDPDARLIEEVPHIDAAIVSAAAGAPGARGTGGMRTKIEAAKLATQHGTHVMIADGRARDVAIRAAAGEPVGTHFLPAGDRTESRRRYLLSGLQVRGRVIVDSGAATALRHGGTSLLPAGVTGASGEFARGDVVHIYAVDGEHVATGVANYARAEVERIRGKHSDQIVNELGYEYSEEIVHRNNLVLV
ncbi:MAG: glutamate 5-kinase [Chloroflexi bacterium]|nr:glutamate 5-kinase [Chloroflexota bacterium]MDA1146750.1 glutamate 5-kinase [Chloroflexota bacterium]MQC82880.1 glutamate 5-kinase [Chloroflexota bacterium]